MQEYYKQFIKLAKYDPHMIPVDKEKIGKFIIILGEYIQGATKDATISTENFASILGFVKYLKLMKQNRHEVE